MRVVIHWFRRDLRLVDNLALHYASEHCDQFVPVYVLSTWKDYHHWTGPKRQSFLCDSLESLSGNLQHEGVSLIIRSGQADQVLLQLARETEACLVTTVRDPDPFGRAMEERVQKTLATLSVDFKALNDTVIHPADEVLTGSQTPYRVFTPYARAWRNQPKPSPLGKVKLSGKAYSSPVPSEPLPTLKYWDIQPDGEHVAGGERAARERLKTFLSGAVLEYADQRNTPSREITSRLSQDLRFGLLSPRETWKRAQEIENSHEISIAERKNVQVFITELIWREFYQAILAHYPEVLVHEFNPKHRNLRWKSAASHPETFQRWCEGRTGFPFVDAGMRQLVATGFMHNRLRMVTAMFLTKDLQIYWKDGEAFFHRHLVDADIASNNGGWQWSAGTGADAAPYFRIQNPWTQGQRFDADGDYIRKWIPELKDVKASELHQAPKNGRPLAKDYPLPMVDHAEERANCLAMFAGSSPPRGETSGA
ncbi:MAG: cryptochrome/photolyase family protein [Verrucomicrobiales bacterium]